MSINQAIVSSNIRGLQSRTHGRGRFIAALEADRTMVKQTIRGLRQLGYAVDPGLLDQRDELNYIVREEAKDQTLDRQLLKQQYVLQKKGRIFVRQRPAFNVGDIVEMIQTGRAFYSTGARARLTHLDSQGDWWGDFRGQGNPVSSFDSSFETICIGPSLGCFKRVKV